MASKRAARPASQFLNGLAPFRETSQHLQRNMTRSMASETPLPDATRSSIAAAVQLQPASTISKTQPPPSDVSSTISIARPQPYKPPPNPFLSTTDCILYTFPTMEPKRLVPYPSTHLMVPFRKDILHRAVIYEADASRQGTASTKWRDEVHGSGRKVRPQKGTGRARLGDKKSPMLKGGGVAFGPKPRDFSTELQKKVYDLAFRTALSYRYRKGELVVIDNLIGLPGGQTDILQGYLRDVMKWNHLTGAFFVTRHERPYLSKALEDEEMRSQAQTMVVEDVEVRDLLQGQRVVIERKALEWILQSHEDDLAPDHSLRTWEERLSKNSSDAYLPQARRESSATGL